MPLYKNMSIRNMTVGVAVALARENIMITKLMNGVLKTVMTVMVTAIIMKKN